MNYPDDFKAEARRLYPRWEELHQRIERGDTFVGRYLDDNSPTTISIKDVLAAPSLEALKEKAQQMQDKVNLYTQWCTLYRQQTEGEA